MEKFVTQAKQYSPTMPAKPKDKKTKATDISSDFVEMHSAPFDTQALVLQLNNLFTPQFDTIKKELSGISLELAALNIEIKQFASRMTEAESRISDLEDLANSQESTLITQVSKLQNMQARLEDLEDRSRRNNIRLVGLPETLEYADLIDFTSKALPLALGFPPHLLPLSIERAHRIGPKRSNENNITKPRICIFKLLKFQDKIEMLRLFRKFDDFTIGGKKILMFQDFSNETAQKRKIMAPICTAMIEKGLKARMLYPAKITVEENGNIYSFTEAGKAKEFITSKETNR